MTGGTVKFFLGFSDYVQDSGYHVIYQGSAESTPSLESLGGATSSFLYVISAEHSITLSKSNHLKLSFSGMATRKTERSNRKHTSRIEIRNSIGNGAFYNFYFLEKGLICTVY
jgi:hypothetical protein